MIKAAVITINGEASDIVRETMEKLTEFEIGTELFRVESESLMEDIRNSMNSIERNGVQVIIATAGRVPFLPSLISSQTVVPVISIPLLDSMTNGLDSLMFTVNTPERTPIGSVAINGGQNAALLAIQMAAVHHQPLGDRMKDYRDSMKQHVKNQNDRLKNSI